MREICVIKEVVRRIFQGFGYDVRKYDRGRSERGTPFDVQRTLLELTDRKNPRIFDVGAHRGQTASAYLDVFSDPRIHSFEAFPDAYRALQERYEGDERVECIQTAVSDSLGEATFYLNHADATNSLLPRPNDKKEYYPPHAGEKGKTTVQTTTLDQYMEEREIETVDILKLDIQGGEVRALQGAKEILQKGEIAIIYSEVAFAPKYKSQPLMHEVWRFVEEYGYSFFNLYNMSIASDGQLHQADAIFVSPAVRTVAPSAKFYHH
nr:FkbM family methyltransferase [Salinibacter ruber]